MSMQSARTKHGNADASPGNVLSLKMAKDVPIRASGVCHYFSKRSSVGTTQVVTALDHVSLDVKEREFVALVGPSGCGKTTLLNLFSGLLTVQSGGIALLGAPPDAARSDVAYMFARDALLPWRTALRNVTFGMEHLPISKADVLDRSAKMLAEVQLSDFAHAYPAQLSHGMRQRVALARTFALPSKILLMDEPFAALDAHLRIEAGDILLRLWERDRRTVVFVTHDLHEAIALADRVVVFAPRPGRIKVEFDVPFKRPRSVVSLQEDNQYHELYRELWHAMSDEPREVSR